MRPRQRVGITRPAGAVAVQIRTGGAGLAQSPSRGRARRVLGFLILACWLALAGGGFFVVRRLNEPIRLPPVQPPLDIFATLFDTTPTRISTTVNWQKISVTVPRWQFFSDHTLWLRMHSDDWDRLPQEVRATGLERLLDRYGLLATNRRAWRSMTPYDWDEVPQPIRAMAAVGMIEYWVSQYGVGESFDLDAGEVLRTVKAIAMSESWFDHRALYVNPDGSMDIGIGGTSDFARRTIRRWFEEGRCDFTMTDDDYYNPWLASRWLAFWFELMLHEARGDLNLAIRAYNWGIGRATAGAGQSYLETVERRRRRYFEGPSRSPTWRVLSQFRRQHAGRVETSLDSKPAKSSQTRAGTLPDHLKRPH